ncbi:glycerate kinase family protein [Corynebacterium tuberculostearicum]|uniref:glycerate kinase family protein n=1 Tax=Corynebacterium tuberculostearicum TaxID=38304 RepID=UPI00265D1F33|nr:glycerate kinase [Corynebacterium tuberculostearicum]WKE57682.1 glycerate kinase [Corynebacterium tuberculostearicum]
MHIVVAPDSFKGTASASEAAASIATGVRQALPDATVTTLPMADGGEGTAAVLAQAAAAGGQPAETISLPTTDAIGRLTQASYFLAGTTAFIDVAAATGLPTVQDCLDPLHADSYGTGVLIADAETRGATSIVLGLGGTASIDAGMGILTALGAAAHDARGYALPKGGAPLVQLDHIDTAQLNIKAGMLDFTLLADTRATPVQAATMYGPQKGAQGEQVALLAGAMLQACEVTGAEADSKFFGAAGGLPIGLSWLSRTLWGTEEHIRVLAGGTHVAGALGLPEKIATADLVITGEGRFDEQSLTGKAVGTIAELAREAGTPLGIIAGSFEHDINAYCAPLSQEGSTPQQLAAAAKDIVQQL